MANLSINKARSYYKTTPSVLTTFNCSDLIPLRCFKVVPNGWYSFKAATAAELPALKVRVNGHMYLETFAVYVSYNQIDKKFVKLITEGHDNEFDDDVYGEGSHTPNTSSVGQVITPDLFTPKLKSADKTGFEVYSGDLLNRLGLPIANNPAHKRTKAYMDNLKKLLESKSISQAEYNRKKIRVIPSEIPNDKFSAYPVRAYHQIYNYCFRSKFLQDPKQTDAGYRESDPANYKILRANRLADWFSRGFVSSQLNPVNVPLGVDNIPVIADNEYAPVGVNVPVGDDVYSFLGVSFKGAFDMSGQHGDAFAQYGFDDQKGHSVNVYHRMNDDVSLAHEFTNNNLNSIDGFHRFEANIASINPRVNLQNAFALGLNDLRRIIGLSHISEKALYGTDIRTILKMNYNLDLPQEMLDEPYLFGYKRVPIQVNSVTQTAPSSDGSTNIGDIYGQSVTIDRIDDGTFRFRANQFGLVMILCCLRHESVYQYGIDPIFTENDKFDYFQPDLQGLSNVGIPKKYIYFTGDVTDDDIFNFNEPYSELKHDPSVVNGEFASDSELSLDMYTLADIYDEVPYFDNEWIQDTTKEVLDRCLTITSENANQVHAVFNFTYERVLPMADYFIGYDYI